MTLVFCSKELALLMEKPINMKYSKEFMFISRIDELNAKLVIQKGSTNVIVFSDIIYESFNSSLDEMKSYITILKSLGDFNLIYLTNRLPDDDMAVYLANNGVQNVIKYKDIPSITIDFLVECTVQQNNINMMIDLVDLKKCNLDMVVATYKYLIDRVYSELGTAKLTGILSKNRERFIDIEYKLQHISQKITDIENMVKLKDTQLSAYNAKMKDIRERFKVIDEVKEELSAKLTEKEGEIAYLNLQHKEIQQRQEKILGSRKYTSNSVFYTCKDIDLLRSDLKAVIVFKEYTYTRYFNTFIKYFYEHLKTETKTKKAYKTRVVIYDQILDDSGFKKFSNFFPCSENDYINKIAGKDLLITNEVKSTFMKEIVEPSDYEILIVIDRRKEFSIDMYKGMRVARFIVAGSNSDALAFSLDKSILVSSGIKDAPLFIPTLGAFQSKVKSQLAEKMQYKEHVIQRFEELLTERYDINLEVKD